MEASMARIDQTRWQVTANIARFRELLEIPLDEFQRRQVNKLLTREVKRRRALPSTPRPSGKSAL
jgi:hypothetical protein